jgi:hypothetical protein
MEPLLRKAYFVGSDGVQREVDVVSIVWNFHPEPLPLDELRVYDLSKVVFTRTFTARLSYASPAAKVKLLAFMSLIPRNQG